MDGITSEVFEYGPKTKFARYIGEIKYFDPFPILTGRVAAHLADNETHRKQLLRFLREMITMPGGRILAGAGRPENLTLYNCFVSDTIPDSLEGIFRVLREAAITLQKGGGIGYDFSTLRPYLSPVSSPGGFSSGPISFMENFDKMCGTLIGGGGRRGAQMGGMLCDHPDFETFIDSKRNTTALNNFNISALCTNPFMQAVIDDKPWDLVFGGHTYKTVSAKLLWQKIMQNNWHYAEPGVIFIDTVNEYNNLYYCETINICNPCGEQHLPPNGACLLGSINISKLFYWDGSKWCFDWAKLKAAVRVFLPMLDNVVDRTNYPLQAQEIESKNKRRIGLGVMGMATIEVMGPNFKYGSDDYIVMQSKILECIRDEAYMASVERARTHGSFPMFDRDKFLAGKNVQRLPQHIQDAIWEGGIRNGTLTSIQPTGTISLFADNVSGGLEPVFAHHVRRTVKNPDAKTETVVELTDYMLSNFGVFGTTADCVSVRDHVRVMTEAQKLIDVGISKTINVGDDVDFHSFTDVYMQVWRDGGKACSTFRPSGYRKGILENAGTACMIDPATGEKTCS